MLLTVLVGREILLDDGQDWGAQPETMWIVFARFICGIVLHVSLSAELQQGMKMMKYAVNHPWKFVDYRLAYSIGLMQTAVVITVEVVNFVALITNDTVLDIVMNFLALVVIAEFDDFFYSASKMVAYQDVITEPLYDDFLIVQTTSSANAALLLEENRFICQPVEKEFDNEAAAKERERKNQEAERKADEKERKALMKAMITHAPSQDSVSPVSPVEDEASENISVDE